MKSTKHLSIPLMLCLAVVLAGLMELTAYAAVSDKNEIKEDTSDVAYGASATWDAEKLETLQKFDTDVSTASDGCMMMGLPGEYIGDQQAFLDRINAIRREACEQNIINPETGRPLTDADYVPLKWSHELEEIARIRAAETSMTADHIRTNGDSWQSVDSEYTYVGECVAWNYDSSATAGIDQWYNEKEKWMDGDENGSGYYTTLIRPSMRYVGGATFYSPCTEYPNTTLVEFCTMYDGDDLDETFVAQVGECVQKLEVNEGNIQGDPYIKGTLSAVKGDERPLFLMTDATYSGFFTANTEGLLFVDDVNWSSSNSEIASVSSDGNVTAKECGSATITAQAENGASASAEFTVEHVLQKVPAVEATCTEAGNIEYWSCENCGKLFRDSEGTQEISQAETVVAAGHDLSKAEAKAATCTAAGNIEYWKCSECGKYFSDEGTTEIEETATVVPVKPHTLTHVEAKAATCTEAGNIEYWKCSECGKYFSDEGTTEIEETATIEKADPAATAPAATATYGQTLADVTLTNPEGNTPGTWAWADTTLSVGDVVSPAATFKANFTPSDTVNYNSKTDMDVAVTVGKADATDAMTAAAVSIEARNGETATVSYTLPDGASYGTATNENTEFFTVSAANGLVLTSAKNWTASDWAADAPKTFTVAISGATNYKDYTLTVTVTPIYKAIQTITAADVTATYGDTGKKIEAGTTGDGTLSYAVKSGDVVTVDKNTGALTIVKAGSAVITVTAAETATYAKATRDVNVTINKANAVPATVTANIRNYDGTKKNLVTVDESTLVGGKMYYALGENATTAPEDNLYTTSIPTKTDAGTYYVWYKVKSDSNYSDTVPEKISVEIKECPHSKTETRDAKVETCTSKGYTGDVYCLNCGKKIKTGSEKPASGHEYGASEYIWSEDGKNCTATAICSKDTSHKLTEEAAITSTVKTAATATSKGTTTYTATFKNEIFKTQTKDVADIPVDETKSGNGNGDKSDNNDSNQSDTDNGNKSGGSGNDKSDADNNKSDKEGNNKSSDTSSAKEVENKINELPDTEKITVENKAVIEAAREAYNKLTDDEKSKVGEETLKKLELAETALKEAEDKADENNDKKDPDDGSDKGGNSGSGSGNGDGNGNGDGSSNGSDPEVPRNQFVATEAGTQYYKEDGTLARGEWIIVNETYYYINTDGYTASEEWVDNCWINADGSCTYDGVLEWKNNETGWWVEDSNGWYPSDQWEKIDGIWYYFNPEGYMASGEYYNGYWFNVDGSWDPDYYLEWKTNGTGWWVEDISGWWPSSEWLKIDGKWYYFGSDGYMVTNQYVDGYWIGEDGTCQ